MPILLELENCIRGMTRIVREETERKAKLVSPGMWWVLAVGGELDPDDFEQREAQRGALLEQIVNLGLTIQEYVWVWDRHQTAQLMLAEFDTRDEASDFASRLADIGLRVRVREEMRD